MTGADNSTGDDSWQSQSGGEEMPGSHSQPRHAPDVVARQVAGETIIVPIKSSPGEMNDIFTLNEVATRTWDLIDGKRTVADIAATIAAEFEVSPEQSLSDTRDLISAFLHAQVALCPPEESSGEG